LGELEKIKMDGIKNIESVVKKGQANGSFSKIITFI
jgi:hypothetical protein